MQVVVVTSLLLLALAHTLLALSDKSDIPGRFCEGRRTPCCQDRRDECSVPIMHTLCYCDEFCDRPNNDDCCPDYPYVCRNQTRNKPRPPIGLHYSSTPRPATSCWFKDRWYPQGSGFKINCNECKCDYKCSGRGCGMEMTCEMNSCLVDPEILTSVNRDQFAGWKATNYSTFWGHTLDQGFTRRLGTRHSKRRAYTMRPINAIFDRERVRARLRYDLRNERPDMISPPLDQGWCAADWVISTVQVASDRLMLVSKGEDHATLSPQQLLSCNAKNQRGCEGGHLTRAWKFIQKFGLVPEACYPWVGYQTNCSVSKIQDKSHMTARCSNGNAFMPLHRTGPVYRVSKEPEAIMNEIIISGPVQGTMRVFQDFFSYRSGIYRCPVNTRNQRNDNYHSVRIVGWGEEVQLGRIVQYWIVSNSWGTWWGENGFFRIVRGENECEIESLILASWINPIVPKKDPSMPMMEKDNFIRNTL